MTTEDVAERILPAAFAAQADNCADPRDVLAAVRRRTRRQRALGPALMVTAVAAVVGVSAAVATLTGNQGPATVASLAGNQASTVQQAAATSTSHLGMDQLSGTCLDMEKVKTLWVSQSAFGGVGSGDNCSQEADAIQTNHPPVISTVNAGNRKVYLAKAPSGIRVGFIALTAAESTAAVRASGNPNASLSPQFLIVAIPDDNPQEVLISIITQYQLPN